MSKTVAIIGLGYVGLPLACLCAKKGFEVVGLDKNPDIVDKINKGISHIKEDYLQKSLNKIKIKATTSPVEVKDAKIFIICVPTPLTGLKEPEFGPLESVSKSIGRFIKKGDLVVVESTVFPGTCENYVLPILDKESGLKAGENYYFTHCPERVNPGDVFWNTENIPRVVGGLTKVCTDKAAEL